MRSIVARCLEDLFVAGCQNDLRAVSLDIIKAF
jgi:hypothetical protein